MFTSGFFNSVDGDRRYDAEQMSSIFDGIINDGVFMSQGDKLMVTANTGMSVVVGSGRAWFYHTWSNNDAPIVMAVEESHAILPRIDVVVLEVNHLPEARTNDIKILKGVPGSFPVAPSPTNINGLRQYPLAHILVPALATQIVQGNITNKVGTAECPFVTGILSTMNIDALVAQWGDQWNAWLTATQQAEDTWTADKHAAFLAWQAAEQSAYDTWESGRAAEFAQWFNTMQGQLATDAAGALAQEIYDLKMLSSMGGMY